MKTKHTPAPWEVRFFDKLEPESGFFVQAKNNNMPELGYGLEILQDDFGEHCGYPTEQRLADAKLIAASPELLDILGSIVANWHLGNEDNAIIADLIDKAESLIEKTIK